ncbi:hypothetical protein NCAS_0I01370 [Naumovozyma castellii]|uniref:CCAAT-binding factor domain-containing protein n=1 Tax=Naumovozyma castellii TaxID=27288 RepID=G0VJX3_NAUCA|nr:hypothetical protein NCAS_0I01370 [Naumovozyma castellii CBS 4309]CCC71805.1 hypothetical protein NCAS_0I01370 [Naumovozyma castellii CBS 4309]
MKTIGLEKTTVDVASDVEDEPSVEEEGKQSEEADVVEKLSSDSDNDSDEEKEEEHEPKEPKEQKKKDSGLITQTHLLTSDKTILPFDVPWYNIPLDPQVKENVKNGESEISKEQISTLFERGKQTLEMDNQTYYEEFTKDSSQRKFMSQILSDGTLNDKISALTLLIQDSPLHNTKSLDTLLSYCNKKSRNSQLQSLNALKDLFLNGMLPPNRKLRYFKNQPGLSMMLNKNTLAVFYFEDYLKKLFFQILETLEKLSHDPIIHVRSTTLTHIFDLLTKQPEQEFNLLRLGVNKLGDIDSKVSSKASFLLLKLEQAHPNMKSIVIDSIVDTALRPNADYHTTYYSVITLNQTILKRSEDSIANKLIKTYFTLFEKFLISTEKDESTNSSVKSSAKGYEAKRKKNFKRGKKGGKSVKNDKTEEEVLNEKNSKLFSALLTGINRSFPFAQLPASVYETHLETLYKITHSSNFNTSVQALVLINQVTVKAELNNDRYYRTLYESLFDPRLVGSSKQGIYLNLLYKSLKQDSKNVERVEAFVKRILQVSSHWLNIGTVAGFLFLLIQLVQIVPQIKNLLTNTPLDHVYESDNEEGEGEEKTNEKGRLYDARKRDPKFANADKSSLWEIIQFNQHFHPTVQAYASKFIEGDSTDVVKPDLGLFTLAHFLDRFVYRNAKQKSVTRGTSIMQPLFGGSQIDKTVLVKASDVILDQTPVNTENWLDMKVDEIKPEDKFFYQYFANKKNAIKKGKQDEKDVHGFDSDEEMDEDEIWDALVKSRPDVEDDSDDGELNLDDEDFSSMSSSEGEDAEEEAEEAEAKAELEKALGESADEEASESDLDGDVFYSFADEEAEQDASDSGKRSFSEVSSDAEVEEEEEEDTGKKQKKSKKNSLPVFASADEYAQYLESDSE